MAHCDKIMRLSGYPILFTASKQLLAKSKALGLAFPTSSLAKISMRLAINLTSSPPAIILDNQYTAPLGSEPRILFMNAEMIS